MTRRSVLVTSVLTAVAGAFAMRAAADEPGRRGPDAGARTETILLGTPALTAGIPGSGPLTVAEIRSWLAEPRNHVVLVPVLPLGLDSGSGQEQGLAQNPLTRAKIELGRQLYFDKRLSADGSVSCATCHDPAHGWAAPTKTGEGIRGQRGARNSPVSYNRILSGAQFWDGRAASLEEQAVGPIQNPIEMGNTHEACVKTLAAIEGYRLQFERVFGGVTIEAVGQALASFERAIVTGPTRFDLYERFVRFKDVSAEELQEDADLAARAQEARERYAAHPMSEPAVRGRGLFFGKANCSACHVGPNLTDESYRNVGVGMDAKEPDLGRHVVTKAERDRGAFKVPTVRNVAQTAPYMHDGSQATLEEVVAFYDKGGHPNAWLDEKVRPLGLTADERAELVAFLEALTGEFPKVETGRLP